MTVEETSCSMTALSKAGLVGSRIPAGGAIAAQTANAPVLVYNSDIEPVAYLQNAKAGYTNKYNEVGRAWFTLPIDDPKASECTHRRYVEIFNDEGRIDMYRIIRTEINDDSLYYECEHVLATLLDDRMIGLRNPEGLTSTEVIEYVLSQQGTVRWELGTCDFDRNFWYQWNNKKLLQALFEIPQRYYTAYQWTWDTSSYPWTLNLIDPSDTVLAYIDYSRNLRSISKTEDSRDIVTRLYAYGQGVSGSVNQVSIRSENPTGEDYIDAAGADEIIPEVWEDQRYTDPASLYQAAGGKLDELSSPKINYEVDAADLFTLTHESIDQFTVGVCVHLSHEKLGIDTSARVVSVTKDDLTGEPESIQIEIANKAEKFIDYGDLVYEDDLDGVPSGPAFSKVLSTSIEAGKINLSAIPGGTLGAIAVPPTLGGLHLGASHMGYHNGSKWITYQDILGRSRWEGIGGDSAHLYWDPRDGGSLDIKSVNVDIEGTVTITGGSGIGELDDAGDLAVLNVIGNAYITDLEVDKLTAGDLNIEMNLIAGGLLKSDDYVAGSSGWKIDNDGSAEFQGDLTIGGNATFEGNVIAASFTEADVTSENETFSQDSDIDSLQTTNGPAESDADKTASWMNFPSSDYGGTKVFDGISPWTVWTDLELDEVTDSRSSLILLAVKNDGGDALNVRFRTNGTSRDSDGSVDLFPTAFGTRISSGKWGWCFAITDSNGVVEWDADDDHPVEVWVIMVIGATT